MVLEWHDGRQIEELIHTEEGRLLGVPLVVAFVLNTQGRLLPTMRSRQPEAQRQARRAVRRAARKRCVRVRIVKLAYIKEGLKGSECRSLSDHGLMGPAQHGRAAVLRRGWFARLFRGGLRHIALLVLRCKRPERNQQQCRESTAAPQHPDSPVPRSWGSFLVCAHCAPHASVRPAFPSSVTSLRSALGGPCNCGATRAKNRHGSEADRFGCPRRSHIERHASATLTGTSVLANRKKKYGFAVWRSWRSARSVAQSSTGRQRPKSWKIYKRIGVNRPSRAIGMRSTSGRKVRSIVGAPECRPLRY